MGKQMDTKEYLDTLCGLLAGGAGEVSAPVAGESMCPFLYPGDQAILTLPGETLKNGEVYLFRRSDGSYVLHRLLRQESGRLWMLGDNQRQAEPVSRDRVCARLAGAVRKGKPIAPGGLTWWFFAGPWRRLRHLLRPMAAALR